MKRFLKATLFSLIVLTSVSCHRNQEVKITLSGSDIQGNSPLVEIDAKKIFRQLGSPAFFVTDGQNREIPSQLTYDSLIVFRAPEILGNSSVTFTIHPADSFHKYENVVYGGFYPERRDDLAYENEQGGYRIYGPGTQSAGENSFGYDIFFKYPSDSIILPSLYAEQTSEDNWRKVDSLRKIDPKLAKDFEDSFTYHLDHGKGMDSFAVGNTLGAGAPAILLNDSILFPWCYESAEILDNGPLRFTCILNFGNVTLPDGSSFREHRLISLDAGSSLNNSKVWYEGIEKPVDIVVGFPLRDDSEPLFSDDKRILTYAAPAQNPEYGKALLGIVMENRADSIVTRENHILMVSRLDPNDTISYKWGFTWDKTGISDLSEWLREIEVSGD